MSGRPPTIRLSGVRREYRVAGGPKVTALAGVDLEIAPGSFVSIEGPSGCGKTTLLNLLGLIDVPTAGVLEWDGVPLQLDSDAGRARRRLLAIGFIFQRFYLLPTLTAQENVELPLRAARVAPSFRRDRAGELLRRVGLAERARAYPHQLSGGEEQRVAIARALANGPQLILADEPTGELDRANTDTVLEILESIHRQDRVTVLVVTHNPRVAARATRHLVMADGRIVADVTPNPEN